MAPRLKGLSRCFSTKTVHNVDLGCEAQATAILGACRADRALQHAVLSLRVLHDQYERGYNRGLSVQQYHDDKLGIEHYSLALRGLASRLSLKSSTDSVASALLCCQLFISIEQARQDYRAMVLHMLRGLAIMHEHAARPSLMDEKHLRPAARPPLPMLDLFLIKLFSAPCKFAEKASPAASPISEASSCTGSSVAGPAINRGPRHISPDTRGELVRLAAQVAQLLQQVSLAKSAQAARCLRHAKAELLKSLDLWAPSPTSTPGDYTGHPEPLTVLFMRLFHALLQVILLPVLELCPHDNVALVAARARLEALASIITDQVQDYSVSKSPDKAPDLAPARLVGAEQRLTSSESLFP
ncbi:uncharacterized protein B0I36DRAFT_355797 [Microdochium trichocladiopsis]|uniref:Uncharacterized protein n=1 Tax=Microdochium trichocladiopsis TaxID=1682393 RepID=A0A9P8XVL6_9PEZI|nr:uncharacterized protein B0I36DRAFT_355797 [Microdochium trichocladiopsis]KAH7014607.1 hypothetical protein B0I36DRAFT_355797 [Microdochium trichocladiopsis]